MNTSRYISLLANPQSMDSSTEQDLKEIINQYPYFQSARALQLKGLKNEHSHLYNNALKVTAAYTTDRDILFDFITSETFTQDHISEIILQQSEAVKGMEVVHENVTEHISLEINEQIKSELKKAEAILDPALFEKKAAEIHITVPEADAIKEEVEEIHIDAPIPFEKKDTHSFGEWLKLTKAKPIERSTEKEKITEKGSTDSQKKIQRKFELIEKFIQDRPKLEPKTLPTKNSNLAKPYTKASDTLMTETLAKVYLQQKNYKKAIQAYKILILKNPEKSGFFADQIRAIEKLIKTEEK